MFIRFSYNDMITSPPSISAQQQPSTEFILYHRLLLSSIILFAFTMALDGLPSLESLPHDKDDCRFVKSFDCVDSASTAEAVEFFNMYGFVVLRSVFDASECEQTREAMWSILESGNPDFKHNDQTTWGTMKSKGNYGLSTRGPSFHPVLVNNRQNEKLARALHALVSSPDPCCEDVHTECTQSDVGDLIVSHDRFTVYRATVLGEEIQGQVDGAQFSTGDRNIHLDMNPWWWLESSTDILKGLETLQYKHKVDPPSTEDSNNTNISGADVKAAKKAAKATAAVNEHADFVRENNMVVQCMGRHVQCVLNFLPNLPEDGGTLVVPMFHKYLRKYCEDYKYLRKPLPWVQFSKEVEEVLLAHSHRVPMREGSVLVWDQRLAHGTAPNSSSTCRMAQYMKAGLRSQTFPVENTTTNDNNCHSNIHHDHSADTIDSKNAVTGDTCVHTIETLSIPVASVSPAVSSRLLRRSTALEYILRQNNAREIVTPLGEKLFALDVL